VTLRALKVLCSIIVALMGRPKRRLHQQAAGSKDEARNGQAVFDRLLVSGDFAGSAFAGKRDAQGGYFWEAAQILGPLLQPAFSDVHQQTLRTFARFHSPTPDPPSSG
jgi:hypothetical protein